MHGRKSNYALFQIEKAGSIKKAVMVSACLAGATCRYHGRAVPPRSRLLERLKEKYGIENICLFCAEQAGGLPTPRPPTYRKNGRLIAAGKDVTMAFAIGAQKALNIAEKRGVIKYYGLRNSPSCDPKTGVTCKLLSKNGIKCHYG